jgi:hypothetical protein
VESLSLYEAMDFRTELIHAIMNPGAEYDLVGDDAAGDEAKYKAKLEQVDTYIASLTDAPPGGNLP